MSYCGAARDAQIAAHLVCDYCRKRRFSKTRRAVKQGVIQRLSAQFCGMDINSDMFLNIALPDVFRKKTRAQTEFAVFILRKH